MVHAGRGQQAGYWSVVAVDAPIGEDEQREALGHGRGGLGADAVHRRLHRTGAFGRAEQGRDRLGPQLAVLDVAYLLQLAVGEERLLQLELVAMLGGLDEQVLLRAHEGLQRGDELLANSVEWRVRYLGEELPEVVEQQRVGVRKHGQRRVIAHGAHGVLAVHGHRFHEHAQVFHGVPEDLLALEHGVMVGLVHECGLGQVIEGQAVGAQPLPIGLPRREVALNLVVLD